MTAWFEAPNALDRFIADLLYAEALRLRPGGPCPAPTAFEPAALIGEAGLGFDSLERLSLAAALSEALLLHHGALDDALVVANRLVEWRRAAAAALQRFSGRVCFRSSGSSGAPKRCEHAIETLDAEIAFFAAQLPRIRRVVTAVSCHHIYGFLFTLMLPARLGIAVRDVRGRLPGGVVAALRPGDLVVGHPAFWAALCRAAPSSWPSDVIGVSSGAPCAASIADAAANAGLARLLDIFGSSETGGIGWRDEPGAPFRLLPFWRPMQGGVLLLRGDATTVTPPDDLRWPGPDYFVPQGRRDAAVQVAGLNVSAAHVRDVLRKHPRVADTAVRLMAPHEGDRLKAYVVPRDIAAPHDTLRKVLTRYAERHLSPAECPRAFSFGPTLPQTVFGKPADWPVPAHMAMPPS